MAMQTDVFSTHQHDSGFAFLGRTRLKGFSVRGDATAGQLDLFDTASVPVAATYGQTGLVVTITKNAHGLTTGQQVGIAFEDGTGGAANGGNFVVTVVDANTFTVPAINSRSVTAGADCRYASAWVLTIELAATDIYNNYQLLPGEGILVRNGLYSYFGGGIIASTMYLG